MPETNLLPPIWNIPYRRNPFFTGRDEALTALYAALQANNAVALTQPQGLSGLGGIGKTQTAVEYAYRYHTHYQAVLWANAHSSAVLASEFLRLATLLQLPESVQRDQQVVLQAVLRWLRNNAGWLLIFDNVEDVAHLDPFLPGAARGHILLTSRARAFSGLAQNIALETLTDEVGALFLLRRTELLTLDELLEAAPEAESAQALSIAHELDGLPLALEQAGAYIQSIVCTLAEYLLLLGERRLEILQQRDPEADYPEVVATTWSLSFEKVAQAEPAGPELLAALAFLYPEAIPEEIFTEGYVHLGEVLGPEAADPLQWDRVIAQLLRFSLISRHADDNLFTMHRLVQAVLQDRLEPDWQHLWVIRVVQAVADIFPSVQFETWSLCQRYLLQAQTCAVLIEEWELAFANAARLLNQTAAYLRDRARYAEAEPLYLRAIVIWQKTLGNQHPYLASCFNNLGLLYAEQGKYQEAEPWYHLALAIWTYRGTEEESIAITLNNLAQLYRLQGKFAEAEPLYQRSLQIREQVLGSEHPSTATALRNLSLLYLDQDQDQLAEQLLQRALAIQQRTLDLGHPDVAANLAGLAIIASRKGDYRAAEDLLAQVLALSEDAYGQQHPETASALNNLALSVEKQGRYALAEKLYLRAHAISLHVFGLYHPRTAASLSNIAGYYSNRGEYEKAITAYQEAVDVCEHTVGPDHLNTAIVLNNFAETHRKREAFTEAEPLYHRALDIIQHVHGPEHRTALSMQGNLALLFYAQGKYAQAEMLQREVLALRQKVLGPQHPDTTPSIQNLAQCYLAQHKYEQAEALYRETLAIWQQNPEDHQPRLALGLHNLALCLVYQGRFSEAEALYRQALAILQELVDDTHPDMQILRQHYADLLLNL